MTPAERIDLPRGALELLVLKTLTRGPAHGYAVLKAIQATSRDALSVEEGSLYPALHRMEKQGWIDAGWETTASGREAKVYRLSRSGRAELARRTRSWKSMTVAVGRILEARTLEVRIGVDPGRNAVEEDVRREIAAHLELAAEDAVGAGADPARAKELALARFGDVERVVRTSHFVKRKEHILMQRLNTVVVAILGLAVIALTAQTFALREESRQMARAMERILAAPEGTTIGSLLATPEATTIGSLLAHGSPPEPVDPEEIGIHVGDRVTVNYPTGEGRTAAITDEVDRAGMMRIPEVGRVKLAGLSRPAAEAFLNARYAEFYVDPMAVWIDVRSAYLD